MSKFSEILGLLSTKILAVFHLILHETFSNSCGFPLMHFLGLTFIREKYSSHYNHYHTFFCNSWLFSYLYTNMSVELVQFEPLKKSSGHVEED